MAVDSISTAQTPFPVYFKKFHFEARSMEIDFDSILNTKRNDDRKREREIVEEEEDGKREHLFQK